MLLGLVLLFAHFAESLEKFTDTVRQMLEDVEERLVFRTNVFFQHDLSAYRPSPGDLAYPEKLEQMEVVPPKYTIVKFLCSPCKISEYCHGNKRE